jgi:dUTP pyrophosphatase
MYTLHLYTEDQTLLEQYQKQAATKYNGDSGIDLYVPFDYTHPGSSTRTTYKLDHNIICWMTVESVFDGTPVSTPSSYYLYPRSSIVNTPFRLANSVGIIDAGYRGHIIAALDCVSENPFEIKQFTRLVQICAPNLSPVRLQLHDKLDEPTERGTGGFGSTGK